MKLSQMSIKSKMLTFSVLFFLTIAVMGTAAFFFSIDHDVDQRSGL